MKMILLITEDRAGFRTAKPGLRDRLQTWIRSSRLDSDLARGVPPESTAALAIHAERLARPATCRQLARSITRIAAEARPESWTNPIVPLCRDEVRDARSELEALADRLAAEGPVSAKGVAQVRVLLTDGTGPLYCRSQVHLKARAGQALAALDPSGT
jgi:hypothetical protein